MTTGVLVINFGEPERPVAEEVVPFLERIFHQNASLEDHPDEEARRRRSRELAERRAPGLIAEYRAIGGSPLAAQAHAQAEALADELGRRGRQARVYAAFQFTAPLVADVVERARDEGVRRLVALPVYPLCGPSTTVAALNQVQVALDALGWTVPFDGVSGWHRHPLYLGLRADAIRKALAEHGLDPNNDGTRLVFSAHGTPLRYIEEGSRYVTYVEEFCREVAALAGVERYELGYQNHANRGIAWTEPDVESVIRDVDADTVLVDPVSFMHEQSETLAELDQALRGDAEERGLTFHRVPVPHDDPRFATVLADLVDPFLAGGERPAELPFSRCRCRPEANTMCLNNTPVASVP